jgi:hypothetical protein
MAGTHSSPRAGLAVRSGTVKWWLASGPTDTRGQSRRRLSELLGAEAGAASDDGVVAELKPGSPAPDIGGFCSANLRESADCAALGGEQNCAARRRAPSGPHTHKSYVRP